MVSMLVCFGCWLVGALAFTASSAESDCFGETQWRGCYHVQGHAAESADLVSDFTSWAIGKMFCLHSYSSP